MSQNNECKCQPENAVNVPITGITVPFCGFGVNIDPSALPKCECGLTREDVQAMIEEAVGNVKEETQEIIEASRYNLCEFYFFRNPALRPGFQPADGGLLENAAALYPEAWAYLQTAEGQALCKTEDEWQAMAHATWATLADGTNIGWDGVGGAPFYAPDFATGALRLPDIRGMYAEAAGFDSLDVGGVHGDASRRATGAVSKGYGYAPSGPFYGSTATAVSSSLNGTGTFTNMDVSRIWPVANKFQVRAFGVLPCVYLGVPR